MSLESKLEALTAAVVTLTATLQQHGIQQASTMPAAPQPIAPVAPVAPMPQAMPVVAATPVMTPANGAAGTQMPTPPTFPVVPPASVPVAPAAPIAAPVAAPAATGAPFSDQKGLMDYVMTTYKTLGPVKGARIQGVLGTLGYQNIGDVKPEHYAHLHAGVEALKAAP